MSQGKLQTASGLDKAARKRSYAELDAIIMAGMHKLAEVACALKEMKNGKRYRDGGYATFEDYCNTKLGWSRQTAYAYIAAARVLANVQSIGQSPPSFTQLSEMAVLTVAQQRELASATDFAKTTVRQLKEKIDKIRRPPRPRPIYSTIHTPASDDPIRQVYPAFNIKRIREEWEIKCRENSVLREEALLLIEEGFKARARKIHPDVGGTDLGMQRLNEVRKILTELMEGWAAPYEPSLARAVPS